MEIEFIFFIAEQKRNFTIAVHASASKSLQSAFGFDFYPMSCVCILKDFAGIALTGIH